MVNGVTKTFPHSFGIGRSNASKEINHAKLMGEKNIGPKVHRTTKTLWKSTMIMNKMNGTVMNARRKKIELSKGDMKKIIKLVLKMHKEGYYHGNMWTNKVMWKQLEDGKNFKLVGFKLMDKIKGKVDYKDVLSFIKSGPDKWENFGNYKSDILSLFRLLRFTMNNNNNNNNSNSDFYYDLMKQNEHMYKFSKWFRETVEAEVKNLNNKNKKRNNNNNNNLNNFRIRDSNRKRNNNNNN